MTKELKIERDGFTNLLYGMDSGKSPLLIRENQAAFLVNVTVRGGYVETRPGFSKVRLTYERDDIQDWIATHRYQGGGFYRPLVAEGFFIVSIGGRIFKITIQGVVSEITPFTGVQTTGAVTTSPVGSELSVPLASTDNIFPGYPVKFGDGVWTVVSVYSAAISIRNIDATAGVLIATGSSLSVCDPNASNRPLSWHLQAEQYWLIQDGQSRCIIFDGSNARRSNEKSDPYEVPTGTCMEYYDSIGRIAVAVNDQEVALGDINGGSSSLIQFMEEHMAVGGGRFMIPRQYGKITAIRNLPNMDTTLGKGPLLIGTPKRIFALGLPANRLTWPTIDQPLQTMVLIDFGPRSQNSSKAVNGDLYYRGNDGIRSFIIARRNFGQPGNLSMSSEMDRILNRDAKTLLKFGSAVQIDNRLLTTVNPVTTDEGHCYHRGMCALDFHLLSAMGSKPAPAYDGLWTGLNIYQLIEALVDDEDASYVFCRGSGGELELWEINPLAQFDGDGGRQECVIETRSFTGRNETEQKELWACEIWVDRLVGTVDFALQYRPDEYPCWFDWKTRTVCAKAQQCQDDDVCVATTRFEAGYKTRMVFRRPDPVCETADDKPSNIGYSFQLRLSWLGRCRIKKVLVKFREVVERIPD